MRAPGIVLLLLVASAAALPRPGETRQAAPTSPADIRATLDGRTTPEPISDETAIRLVLLNLAGLEQARVVRLRSLGLGESDLVALQQELDRFELQLRAITAETTAIRRLPPTDENRERLRRTSGRTNEAVFATWANLQVLLSAEGRGTLQAYIGQQKTNMRTIGVVPGPDTPPDRSGLAPASPADGRRFADIRLTPSTAGTSIRLEPHPDGWVRMTGTTLRQWLTMAAGFPTGPASNPGAATTSAAHVGAMIDGVHVPPVQIVGAPDWIDTDRFDLVAYAGSGRSLDEIRAMLVAMLQERFGLAARVERRPVDTLVIVRSGPAGRWLLEARPDGSLPPPLLGGCLRGVSPAVMPVPPPQPPGEPDWWRCGGSSGHRPDGTAHVTLRAMPLRHLADGLTRIMDRTVLDRTGLGGSYYVHVEFWWPMGDTPPAAHTQLPDVATALESQTGLALRRTRLDTDVIVIDHVDRLQSPAN